MKLFITVLSVLFAASISFAATSKNSVVKTNVEPEALKVEMLSLGWIPLSSVCYTSSSYSGALASCEDDAKAVNLLSTDRVAMSASCQQASSVRGCPYSAQYAMNVRTLFIR